MGIELRTQVYDPSHQISIFDTYKNIFNISISIKKEELSKDVHMATPPSLPHNKSTHALKVFFIPQPLKVPT